MTENLQRVRLSLITFRNESHSKGRKPLKAYVSREVAMELLTDDCFTAVPVPKLYAPRDFIGVLFGTDIYENSKLDSHQIEYYDVKDDVTAVILREAGYKNNHVWDQFTKCCQRCGITEQEMHKNKWYDCYAQMEKQWSRKEASEGIKSVPPLERK